MGQQLAQLGAGSELTPLICKTTQTDLSALQLGQCDAASSAGLQWSMSATASIFLIASFCFVMCARTLQRDFVATLGKA